jgi:arginine/ornithine transport system permease protein
MFRRGRDETVTVPAVCATFLLGGGRWATAAGFPGLRGPSFCVRRCGERLHEVLTMFNGYAATIVDGAWLTLQLALLSMALAAVLGLVGAAFRLSPVRWLAWCGDAYSTVIRGVPDLVLILLIFYGGQQLVNVVAPMVGYEDYIDLDPFWSGVFTLGFIFGAYLSETFRGAFMAIPKGQGEAGLAYGMSHTKVFFRILVPQMIRLAIPGFTNNWLVLTKATALISVVGLQDMMFKAKSAADATREPFTFYLAVAALYLVLTSVSLLALRYLERRYSAGIKAAEL